MYGALVAGAEQWEAKGENGQQNDSFEEQVDLKNIEMGRTTLILIVTTFIGCCALNITLPGDLN